MFKRIFLLGNSTLGIFSNFIFLGLVIVPLVAFLEHLLFGSKILVKQPVTLISHLLLWCVFLAGIVASREKKHLTLIDLNIYIPEKYRELGRSLVEIVSASFLFGLSINSIGFIKQGFSLTDHLVGLSYHSVLSIIPIGFFLMAWFAIFHKENEASSKRKLWNFFIALFIGFLLGLSSILEYALYGFYLSEDEYWKQFSAFLPHWFGQIEFGFISFIKNHEFFFSFLDTLVSFFANYKYWFVIFLLLCTMIGLPLFILLGGAAFVLFAGEGYSFSLINQIYTMLTGQAETIMPALPLFAATGYLLSESSSSRRLVRMCSVFLSKIPSGVTITTVLVCAFFTAFSGASGITILAVGGLLIVPLKEYYRDNFSYGLLTSSGSIGLLFPPSLPLIMYSIAVVQVAPSISFYEMLVAGLIPGILTIALLLIYVFFAYKPKKAPQATVTKQEKTEALLGTLPESLLPLLILFVYFFITANLVTVAAITFVYVFVLLKVRRDLSGKKILSVINSSLPVIGGIFMILAMSKGLSDYSVDMGVPQLLKNIVSNSVESKYVFLLWLNLALLIVGSFMDIFSAIVVLTPLLLPLATSYDINLIHLGVILLANLELGYMTPPVGLNLFLASYRFKISMTKLYVSILPFFFIRLVIVLILTFIPGISTWLPSIVGKLTG